MCVQENLSVANKIAWETKAYQAWVQKYGTPDEEIPGRGCWHETHLKTQLIRTYIRFRPAKIAGFLAYLSTEWLGKAADFL